MSAAPVYRDMTGPEYMGKAIGDDWVDIEWKYPEEDIGKLNGLLIRLYNLQIIEAYAGGDCCHYTFEPASNIPEEPYCDTCDLPMEHQDHWAEHSIYFEYWNCPECGAGVTLRFHLYRMIKEDTS